MKYALVSEEQLKAIESAFDVSTTHFNKDRQTVLKAREIIQSLKPQEPVAWNITHEKQDGTPQIILVTGRYKDIKDACDFGEPVPLFALEKSE